MTIYAAMSQFVCDIDSICDVERLQFFADKAARQHGVKLTKLDLINRVGVKGVAIKLVSVEFTDGDSSVSTVLKVEI